MEKARIGGVLSIVASALGILIGLLFISYPLLMTSFFRAFESEMSPAGVPEFDAMVGFMWLVFGVIFLFYLVIGALGIVGGIYALKGKSWGLSLAGAIASSMLFYYVGIIAVIFIAMAKPEFDRTTPLAV